MNITKQDIETALLTLPISEGDILLVHSSLKSAGYIEGGADTVIDALLEVIGEKGTLVMPTLSMGEFHNAYRDWNMDRPSDTGYITEVFRNRKGSLRSDQATHSVAAQGPMAAYLTKDHADGKGRYGTYGSTPFSHTSPWQKMYEANAKVLFFGCGLDKNTLKHLVEYMIVEKTLEAAKRNNVYTEVCAKIMNFEARVAGNTVKIWPYLSVQELQRLGKEKSLLQHSTCGNATLTMYRAKELIDAILNDVSQNTQLWYGNPMVDIINQAFGGKIPTDAFVQ